jgi:hypothetical protein
MTTAVGFSRYIRWATTKHLIGSHVCPKRSTPTGDKWYRLRTLCSVASLSKRRPNSRSRASVAPRSGQTATLSRFWHARYGQPPLPPLIRAGKLAHTSVTCRLSHQSGQWTSLPGPMALNWSFPVSAEVKEARNRFPHLEPLLRHDAFLSKPLGHCRQAREHKQCLQPKPTAARASHRLRDQRAAAPNQTARDPGAARSGTVSASSSSAATP